MEIQDNLTQSETEELINKIKQDPKILKHIKNPPTQIQLIAIKESPLNIEFINNPDSNTIIQLIETLWWRKINKNEEFPKQLIKSNIDEWILKIILRILNDENFILSHYMQLVELEKTNYYKYTNLSSCSEFYIKKHLEFIWKWQRRIVYRLNDNQIIKIWNKEQNQKEYNNYEKFKDFDIFPKIYSHSENFERLICEYVLPLQKWDFLKILNMPYTKNEKITKIKRHEYTEPKENKEKLSETQRKLLNFRIKKMKKFATENNEESDYNDYYEYGDFENKYEEWSYVLEFINYMNAYYRKSIKKDSNYYYIDKKKFWYYIHLSNTNYRFYQIKEFIKENPFNNDLHLLNFWFAMRKWKPTIVILDAWW